MPASGVHQALRMTLALDVQVDPGFTGIDGS